MKQQPRIRQMLNLMNKANAKAKAWEEKTNNTKVWEVYDKAYQAMQYWKKAEVRLGQRFVECGSDYIFDGHYVIEHKAELYR